MSEVCKACIAMSPAFGGPARCLVLDNGRCIRDSFIPDPINHPAHYTAGGIETIDYIEAKGLGYHLGNVVKYVSRAGRKDPTTLLEDLRKARYYLNREIERLEKGR